MPIIGTKNTAVNLGFGPAISIDPQADNVLVSNFVAEPGHEGPQILLSWTPPAIPGDVDELRMVRKLGSYPLAIDDGVVILTLVGGDIQNVTNFSDRLLDEDVQLYYYTMFSQKDSDLGYLFDSRTITKSFAYSTEAIHERLYFKLLPGLYRSTDLLQDPLLPLEETVDPENNEVFHFNTDNLRERGPLERYLKIPSLELSRIQAFAEALCQQHDPDTADADFLVELAALVAWEINYDVPIPRQREEIKGAIPIYRIKGSDQAIILLVRNITGYDAEIENFFDNVIRTNTPGRTTLDFTQPVFRLQPGDNTYHTLCIDINPECPYAPLTAGIFITVTDGITAEVLNKLLRILPDFIPFTANGFIYLQDFFDEIYFDPNLDDSDFFDSGNTDDDENYNNPIITNTPGLITNELGSGVTAVPPIISDEFFDTSP